MQNLYFAWVLFHMQYFLYLKRSLTRAWRLHLLFCLCLACAISIPICLSVLSQSRYRACEKHNEVLLGGHNIQVLYAEPGDEIYFTAIPDAVVTWDGDVLYVDRSPDAPLSSEEGKRISDPFRNAFFTVYWGTEGKKWMAVLLEDNWLDPNACLPSRSLNIWVRLFSAFLICIAYHFLWQRTYGDMKQLYAVGADKKKLLLLQLVRQQLLHIPATIFAAAISTTGLCLFMEHLNAEQCMQDSITMPAMENLYIFSVSWLNLCVICISYWFISLLPFGYCTVRFMQGITQRQKVHLPAFRKKKSSAGVVLYKLFSRPCTLFAYMLISVFLLSLAVLLLQQREDLQTYAEFAPDYDLSFSLNTKNKWWTAEDLHNIAAIPGVQHMKLTGDSPTEYNLIDESSTTTLDWDGISHGVFLAAIQRETELDFPAIEEEDGAVVYKVILYPTRKTMNRYEVGMRMKLWVFQHATVSIEIAEISPEICTGVASGSYGETTEREVTIGFRAEDYDAISQMQKINGFTVRLKNPEECPRIQKQIIEMFASNALVSSTNNSVEYFLSYNRAVGMNLLYTTLSVLLFGFFAVITTLSLIDYAASHAETLRLLHMQGASHRAIIAAFVEIMLPPGILTCAVVWAIVTPVEREYYRLRGYTDAYMPQLGIRLDDPLYLAAALAVVAVFVAPVICTVVRQLRRLDRG